jgi:NADH-quinone oxidoreductase subunit J
MDANLIVFLVLALVAVTAAIGMVVNKNAVYSALFLILNFATIAVFYLVLGAPFMAMIQITVYAGAIMVLFLFVIMLLGAEGIKKSEFYDWQVPFAAVLALVLIGEVSMIIFGNNTDYVSVVPLKQSFASAFDIGSTLFQDYFLPFQITAVLLLVAMVGAIVITKGNGPRRRKKNV